ncbi:MAG: hydroxyacid dehydrogenase [Hyphomicrobiaceae bacterium]
MADIVICEFMDEDAIAALSNDFDVHFDATLWQRPGALAAILNSARGLIVRNKTQVSVQLIAAAPQLQVVGRLGVGLDNIDVAACRERDIAVCPATGANATAVAEYVIATTLILLRGAYQSRRRVLAGEWPREAFAHGREAAGKTLGLVGFGSVGQEVARLAKGIGMAVCAFDAMLSNDDPAWDCSDRVSFDEVLERSNVLSLHVPLTDQTRGLIGAGEIERMKTGAILINTARGGIVDEAALVEALRTGKLSGAGLDVFEEEPLTLEGARMFAGLPNLILTPHIAGLTQEANGRVSTMTAEQVRRSLVGER